MSNPISDRALVAALGDWSAAPGGSLAGRLALALRQGVVGGLLAPDTRLPPERHLARLLSVSRSTVTTALDELRADGLLHSRQGSGTVVTGPGAPSVQPVGQVDALLDHGAGIDLAAAAPGDATHLPELTVSTADLVAVVPGHGYEPAGLARTRAAIAAHLTARDLPTGAEQVQVTIGAQQALDLALSSLTAAGDGVVVENHTYPGFLDLLVRHRLRPVPVPCDRRGPEPDAFRAALRQPRVRAAYLMPGGHNPTGRIIGRGRRTALAEALDERGVAIIEDDVLADLAFDGCRQTPLSRLCRSATTVTVGSLSKSCWGGLRIGWLRAGGPLLADAVRRGTVTDLSPPVPSQLLAVQVLAGHYDSLIAARRELLARRAECTLEFIGDALPDWRADRPDAGLAVWVRLPEADAGPFVQRSRRHGVHVAPGTTATPMEGPDPHVRICVDRPLPVLEQGLERLAAAWAEHAGGAGLSP